MTRQEYYEALCKIGAPEVIAASMAMQTHSPIVFADLKEEIYAFQNWHETIEGLDFWCSIIDCLK